MSNLLDSTNEAYHADRSHLSSSALKLLLNDPLAFKAQYIDGIAQPETTNVAFQDGTLAHVLVLEPEKVANYAIFPGLRKFGTAWEEFKKANADKICISAAQMLRAERLYRAYAELPQAIQLVSGGLAEHTMTGETMGVKLKARADYIVPGKYIVDVKTTSMPSDRDVFAETVAQYSYHLSAALYCRVAAQVYTDIHEFYWLVLSKEDQGCRVYKASATTLAAGDALLQRALLQYKKSIETGIWTLEQKTELQEEVEEV